MTRPVLPESAGWMGDPSRGAAMGRLGKEPEHRAPFYKFYLQRIHLDRGGYDSGGAYWGSGQPLYWAVSTDNQVEFFFRAADRAAARDEVTRRYPGCAFFR